MSADRPLPTRAQPDSPVTTRWWWIRHAPVVNAEARIYGQSDVPADTSDGAAYAALAGELPVAAAVWVHSGLIRTRATAEAIADAAGMAPPMIEDRGLMEQHLGAWQGQDRQAFYRERGVGVTRFWMSDLEERPPGGESVLDLVARVQPAIRTLNSAHRGRDIIAVAHGGTIRVALIMALQLPPAAFGAFQTDNLSLTRIEHLDLGRGQELWRVTAVNLPPVHGRARGGGVLA